MDAALVLDRLREAGLDVGVTDGRVTVAPTPVPEWARVLIVEHRDDLVAVLTGRWHYAVAWYGSRRCTFATLGAARGFALALEADRGEEGASVVRHVPGQPLSANPDLAVARDVVLDRDYWVPARLGRDVGADDESPFALGVFVDVDG